MSIQRERRKYKELLNHRENQYLKALDGLLSGKLPPTYLAERWDKLKAVRPKSL